MPTAALFVPVSDVIALLGGTSVALGYKAKLGALTLAVFLIPATRAMHKVWAITDPMMAQLQLAMFRTNASMLGGALLIAYFGAGPLRLDAQTHASAAPINPGR